MTEEQAVVGERSETSAKSPSRLDLVFNVTLVLKGLDGVFEFVGGILLLVISPDSINAWAQRLTQHELSHDPSDFFANYQPLPGATLIDVDVATYPFANNAVAANSLASPAPIHPVEKIAKPRTSATAPAARASRKS